MSQFSGVVPTSSKAGEVFLAFCTFIEISPQHQNPYQVIYLLVSKIKQYNVVLQADER